MKRGAVLWTLAALLGIGLTAGVTWGASLLLSQPIGLASQPASVIDTLAPRINTVASTSRASATKKPAPAKPTHPRTAARGTVAHPVTQTVNATATPPSVPVVTHAVTAPRTTVAKTSPAPVLTHSVTAPRTTVARAVTRKRTTPPHTTRRPARHGDDGGRQPTSTASAPATPSGALTQADD